MRKRRYQEYKIIRGKKKIRNFIIALRDPDLNICVIHPDSYNDLEWKDQLERIKITKKEINKEIIDRFNGRNFTHFERKYKEIVYYSERYSLESNELLLMVFLDKYHNDSILKKVELIFLARNIRKSQDALINYFCKELEKIQ